MRRRYEASWLDPAGGGFVYGQSVCAMPHVVIEEAPNLREVCKMLAPFTARDGGEILRLLDVFVNQAGRVALLDCVVIEPGVPSKSFFVQLSQKERQITVRLLPFCRGTLASGAGEPSTITDWIERCPSVFGD